MKNISYKASRKSLVAYRFTLMCAVTLGGFLTGCDGGTHIKGVVLDSNDAPVANADVTLSTGELKREIKSSDRGVFKIGMTHSPWNPELTLAITKPGFKPFEKRFNAKEHLDSIVATLEPLSEPANVQDASSSPFSLSVVPGRSGITMAKNKPDEFYVVLTNVSREPQATWETWNSWGYQTISFEMTTTEGKKFVVSRRQGEFTKNAPSTFRVKPGENQVFAIRLDEWWETHPTLPKSDEMPITLKAIYEVTPTPEAAEYKVWTGRLESHSYTFLLRQW
jgi:hypothetical protein